jgi:hypothetical protein
MTILAGRAKNRNNGIAILVGRAKASKERNGALLGRVKARKEIYSNTCSQGQNQKRIEWGYL